MRDHRIIAYLIAALAFVLVGRTMWTGTRETEDGTALRIRLFLDHATNDPLELFYADSSGGYSNLHLVHPSKDQSLDANEVLFDLPEQARGIFGLRLDPRRSPGRIALVSISLEGPFNTVQWRGEEIAEFFSPLHDMAPFQVDNNSHKISLVSTGDDPYMVTTDSIADHIQKALDPTMPVMWPVLFALLGGSVAAVLVLAVTSLVRQLPANAPIRSPQTLIRAICWAVALGWAGYWTMDTIDFREHSLVLEMEVTTAIGDDFQIFYATEPGRFLSGHFVNARIEGSSERRTLSFTLPTDSLIKFLRIDPGTRQTSLKLHMLSLRSGDAVEHYGPAEIFRLFKPNAQIKDRILNPDHMLINMNGDDPFLMSDTDFAPVLRELRARSINSILPMLFSLLVAAFTFAWRIHRSVDKRAATPTNAPALVMVLGFALLITLPLLAELIPLEPFVADTEKRPLAARPVLNSHSLLSFPKKYTSYFNDHFRFRKLLFRWNSFFAVYALRSSPLPERVIRGQDGWYFLNREKMVDYYRGAMPFSEDQLRLIAQRLNARSSWLHNRGIEYYLFIAPLSSSIYPEFLPANIHRSGSGSGLDQVKDYLADHCQVKVIDARSRMLALKDSIDLYYKTDIHWNRDGALIGYQTLMEAMLADHPELGAACLRSDFSLKNDTNDLGDLAMQMALNDKLTRISHDMVPHAPWRATEVSGPDLPGSPIFRNRTVFMQGPDPSAPRLLMFRDSFTVYLIPLLSEHFSRSTYVWTPIWVPAIVEQEKPDIVVHELMEVFIDELLDEEITTGHTDAHGPI